MTHGERLERRRRIAEAVRAGMTLSEAERLYGVCEKSIQRACREHGVNLPVRSNGLPAPSTYAVIAALLRGEREARIAERMGVSRQRVNQIKQRCVEAGIPLSAVEHRGGKVEAS